VNPRCRWCGKPATARCTAKTGDATIVIDYCDPEGPCWDTTYREVRPHPERTWTPITRPVRAPQPGPDLLQLLPGKGETPA
jgi:hypothetical protein